MKNKENEGNSITCRATPRENLLFVKAKTEDQIKCIFDDDNKRIIMHISP